MKVQELLESKQYTPEYVAKVLDTYGFNVPDDLTRVVNLSQNVDSATDDLVANFETIKPILNCVAVMTLRSKQIDTWYEHFSTYFLNAISKHVDVDLNEHVLPMCNVHIHKVIGSDYDKWNKKVQDFVDYTSNVSNVRYRVFYIPSSVLKIVYAYKVKV